MASELALLASSAFWYSPSAPVQVALRDELLAAQDGDADGEVGRALEQPVLGVDGDAARTAEGLDGVGRLGAGDVDAAVFRLAFGFDAQLDGHAEEVEVLGDRADRAEALVAAEPEDGVLVAEGGRAGAVEPLGEEGGELEVGLGLGDGLDVGAADAFVGVLREHAAEELLEALVAHLPAEHVEDHRALFERHGLELRREGVEAAEGGERLGVVGQRAGGDVGDGGLEGGLAGGVFEVHQLGVAGHAVGDPGIVERGRRDFGAPPLVRDGVGEEALAAVWSAMRLPAMATISGAQAAETASSGSSTTLMRPDSAGRRCWS